MSWTFDLGFIMFGSPLISMSSVSTVVVLSHLLSLLLFDNYVVCPGSSSSFVSQVLGVNFESVLLLGPECCRVSAISSVGILSHLFSHPLLFVWF